MQTTIRQFQAEVRDILNNDPWFANHGIVWRAEDTLDIEFQIKDAISRTGLAAVVVTPNLTYQGEAATTTSRKNYEKTEEPGRTTWTLTDEDNRTITLVKEVSESVTWSITGGAWGDDSIDFSDEDILDGKYEYEYTEDGVTHSLTIDFAPDTHEPKTVSLSVTKDNLSGKPFDKKLNWIEVRGNAFFNTSVVPDINDFYACDCTCNNSASRSNVITLFGTSTARNGQDQFGATHTRQTDSIYNTRGSYTYSCRIGMLVTASGTGITHEMTIAKNWKRIGAFGGLQLSNTAATGKRAWRFGCQNKDPDMWSANQAATGANVNPTYTNTTIPLAILGPYNGQTGTGPANMANWWGKLYFFKLWDRLRTTRKLDLYPVLKDGNVCLYDAVTNTVLQNGYTGDKSTITWEEDTDFNEVINDNSNVDFVETVKVIDKGFDTEVSLQLIENPTVNRGKPDKDQIATALDAAHHAVYTLAGYDSGNFNNFNASTIRQTTVGAAQNKLLQVEAKLNSTVIL